MVRKHDRIRGRIVGKKEYAEEEVPGWWYHTECLPYDYLHVSFSQLPVIDPVRLAEVADDNKIHPDALPLREFPFIDDFEVVLWGSFLEDEIEIQQEDATKYNVHFFSPQYGFLARFFYGDYSAQDLLSENFRLPRGDFALPYFDFDQGWVMLIAEYENFVYILAGSYEAVREKKGYHTWFKVEKKRYYEQWEQAVHLCRETFQGR